MTTPSKSGHDIGYAMGWLCGAFFPAALLVSFVHIFRKRRREAFQAVAVCALALSLIVAARWLMLHYGLQNSPSRWMFGNVLIFVMFPLFATVAVRALAWPRPADSKPRQRAAKPKRTAPRV